MEIIEWVNKAGYTIVIAPSEIPKLKKALKDAEETFIGEGEGFEISVSPILDEEGK